MLPRYAAEIKDCLEKETDVFIVEVPAGFWTDLFKTKMGDGYIDCRTDSNFQIWVREQGLCSSFGSL